MEVQEMRKAFYQLKTRDDVASLLEIQEKSLRYFLYKVRPENMYHSFAIPKRNGSSRVIQAPNKKLKSIQKKLAHVLYAVYTPKSCVKGFALGTGVVQNAEIHAKKKLIVNVDLEDFFHQIHFGRIRGMLMKPPYSIGKEAATTIAQIACCNGRLPQGAPTSPVLSNMICAPLDNALMRLAKSAGCTYTRYADDITFSTNKKKMDVGIVKLVDQEVRIGKTLNEILKAHSFKVNPEKISIRHRWERQEVTGLTVNEFPNPRRTYQKELRAILHTANKYGVYQAAKHYIEKGLCSNNGIIDLLSKKGAEDQIESWFKKVLIGKVLCVRQVKGAESFTYFSFAKQINVLFNESIFDLSEFNKLNSLINNCTYVLESDDADHWAQGSGFSVASLGLLTSQHVVEKAQRFYICASSGKPMGLLTMKNDCVSYDAQIDFALLKPQKLEITGGFQMGNSRNIARGDNVILVGYPEYSKGNSPTVQQCSVTGLRKYMGEDLWTVSGRIVHGASGGPVLDENYNVIGIIKAGVPSDAEEKESIFHGFLPIHRVQEFLTEEATVSADE